MIVLGREIYERKIIHPHHLRTVHEATGLTYGASFVGYDIRIKQNITLEPDQFALASSLEYFGTPPDLVGFVCDKSSLARMGLFLGVGVIEPGWSGWLTLELKNQNNVPIVIMAGQPIAQIVFHRIDGNIAGYDGRYQDQPDMPVKSKISKLYEMKQDAELIRSVERSTKTSR